MGIFQFIGLNVQVIQWCEKNAIFLKGKNMNSFACPVYRICVS